MTCHLRAVVVLALGLLVAACGGGGPSLPGSSPAPLPGPPRDLTVEVTPLGHVELRWDAPLVEPGRAPVTGYAVYLESPDGQAPERLAVTGAFSYLYTGPVPGRGLETGRSYVFHIRAINRIGMGQASESEGLTLTEPPPLLPPGPPANLTAEATVNNSAFLQWAAPIAAPGRAPVTGYVVYRELPGGRYEELGETESLSYVHPDLTPGESYVFTVRASSEAGLSDASASATVVLPPLLPPGAPADLTVELTPNGDVLLQWTAPVPSADRAPFTHFEIWHERSGAPGPRKLGESRSLFFLHATPQRGETHVYYVVAVSAVGPGRPSRAVSIEVPEPGGILPPSAPGGFTAVLTPDNDVQFEWTEPASDPDRAPVEGYLVYEVTSGGGVAILNPDGDDADMDPDPVDALTYLHDPDPALVPRQLYTYYVRATSAEGTSSPSASASVQVPVDQAPASPEDFTAVLTPNGDVLLQWTAPVPSADRAPFTHFEIWHERSGAPGPRKLGESRSLFFLHATPQRGETHVYYVVAVSAVGPGRPSRAVSIEVPEPGGILPPSAPGGFTAVLTPDNDVQFEWTEPASDPDRAPVEGYLVYEVTSGGGVAILNPDGDDADMDPDPVDALTYLHDPDPALVPRQLYTYYVRATSAEGTSSPSASASVQVPVDQAPASPEDFTAVLTPNGDVLLQWTAPVPSADRAPFTHFEIWHERSGAPGPRKLGESRSLFFLHATPQRGETHVYYVVAVSAVGPGRPSRAVSIEVPEPGGILPPSAPGGFTAVLTPDNDVQFEWTEPASDPDRAPVEGYLVYEVTSGGGVAILNPDGDDADMDPDPVDALTYLHDPDPALVPRQLYTYYVRATSAEGTSSPSASASVQVPVDQAPASPEDFTAVLTPNGDVLLQWTAPVPSADRAPFTHFEIWHERSGAPGPEKLGESRSLFFLHATPQRGETHVYYVLAVSAVGPGRPSRAVSIEVPLEPGGILPPSAPGGFTAVLTPDNDVQFEWTEPASDPDRAPVEGYLVYEVTSGGGVAILNPDGDDADMDPDPVDALTYLHDLDLALVPRQLYTYYVRATSAEGTSSPSASASVEVPFGPLVPLSIPHVTVRADQSGSDSGVTVSWVHNLVPQLQSLVTGFELQYCAVLPTHSTDHCPGDWMGISGSFGPRDRIHTDTVTCNAAAEPPESTARMYRVRAVASNRSLSSRYSIPTRPICPGAGYSPPRRVDAVFAADPTPSRINICWAAPEANGSDLLGYELQATTSDELPETEDGWVIVDAHIDPAGDGPVCRLYSGLVINEVYWFRVRAYNLAGHGHWSAPYHYRHETEVVPPLPARASVQGPVALAVADARASERIDATLTFEVTLDRPASETVTVGYATADGTATAGEDYRAASGTLELAAGETSKTIAVAVHADTEEEGEETLTLRLSNAAGARIADGEATGTIHDRDPLPQEWLARFGRTVAAQAVDAVGTRLASKQRTHARVGGVSVESSASPDSLETPGRQWAEPAWHPWDGPEDTRGISRHALMSASSFHLASQGDGPVWAAWGRFAVEGFEADVHDTRLDGDTTTGFLGADVASGRWLMGAAVSHSEADGAMVPGSGAASARERSDVESTLTGVYPYARMTLSERVSLWGLAGVGQGTLTVSERGRAPAETDIGMHMGALGARGTMLAPSEAGGIALALRSDAFWVRMTSDEARTAAAGDLADIRTDASRVRLFLEAERELEVRGEGTLTPSLEVGVRRDGGDAETGTGLEAGAGMRYAAEGIAIEGAVRRLVTHEASGYEEWGAGGSVRIDPGASGRGLSLTLAPAFGAGPSDTERLWSLGDARRLSGGAETGAGRRLEAEVGYGWRLPITTRGMLTPYAGLSFSGRGTRAWRLGARLLMTRDISFGLEGTRMERSDDASDHAVALHGRLHW